MKTSFPQLAEVKELSNAEYIEKMKRDVYFHSTELLILDEVLYNDVF
jgi:hypothetical protein